MCSVKDKQKACANCGIGIDYYSVAGLAIKYADLEFCSEACVEEWLDAIQDKNDEKYYDE